MKSKRSGKDNPKSVNSIGPTSILLQRTSMKQFKEITLHALVRKSWKQCFTERLWKVGFFKIASLSQVGKSRKHVQSGTHTNLLGVSRSIYNTNFNSPFICEWFYLTFPKHHWNSLISLSVKLCQVKPIRKTQFYTEQNTDGQTRVLL